MDQPDRAPRSSLLAAQLRWLIIASGIDPDPTALECPLGAAAEAGGRLWMMAGEERPGTLGTAMLWAMSRGATGIGFVVRSHAGHVARQASHFDVDLEVHGIAGERLEIAAPDGHRPVPVVDAALAPLLASIASAGAEVVVEHALVGSGAVADSVVSGEVSGLEVCRVTGARNPRLEIGLGAHDREAFALFHAGRDDAGALADVVAHVAPHRRPGAPPHPLNRLAVSRLLRARACESPHLAGARRLEPVSPPEPRRNLLEEVPCAALAPDHVSTFVSGVDPGAVPFALDVAHRHGLPARIVVRGRDDHRALHRLAERAHRPPIFTRFDP